MSLLDTRREDIEKHLAKYPDKRSAVMPLLYIAQDEYGQLTEEAIAEVAELVETDPTHVKGIIGFYTMYYEEKGKYLLYICTDLPCALRGAEEFSEHVCQSLDLPPGGGTTEDGLFTVENVMCIAACDKAPVMQVDFHYHENMDLDKANKLIETLRREHEATQPYTQDE